MHLKMQFEDMYRNRKIKQYNNKDSHYAPKMQAMP